MSASSRWQVFEADFPVNGSPRQRLAFALKYAALAPTEGDWQSWEFRLADTHLEVIVKDDPAREIIDPDGRELMIGCGAALHYLKLALKHFGCLGRVESFPNLDEPALVARVHFGFGRERDAQEQLLFKAMTRGGANSSPLGETPVSATILAALSHAATGERGWLEFAQSEMSRQRVMEVAHAGTPRLTTIATGGETSRWPRPLFAFGGRRMDTPTAVVEPAPLSVSAAALAVVKTKTDDKHGWLAAGQTMARAVLQAQALGLSWSFFNQVRRRQAREALRWGIGHKGFAQIILRLGSLTAAENFRPAATTTATAMFR